MQRKDKRHYFIISGIIGLIGIIIPLTQYAFRRFDDNTFTSWHMIFLTTSPLHFFLLLVPSLILVFFVFRISFPIPRILVVFLACLIVPALFWSTPEVNVSASRYASQAKHLELYGIPYFLKEWGHGIQAWMDEPAVPFFDGLIFKIFGESRIYIQLFTSLLFALTSVVTYLIGKTLWDEDTGFYAGILLLGIPYLIIQTPLMLLDVHTMFFLTLSIYLYIRAVEAGGISRTTAAACAIFVACFCKYSVWPMLSVLPVISLVYYFQREDDFRRDVLRTTLRVFLFSFILVGIPILFKLDVVVSQIKLLLGFQGPSLGRWTETWASIFFFQTNPVITIAAAVSIVLAGWKRDLKYLIVVWLPFLIVLFHLKRIRYILPVFPMMTLMAAQGLGALRNRDARKMIVISVVITSLSTCFFLYLPFLQQWSAVNLKDAGQFLDSLNVDTVEVITVPQKNYPVNPAVAVPLLDLFTHKRIFYHYVPDGSTPDEDYHTSRFRDSWEYLNPAYYEADTRAAAGGKALVVIAADLHDKIPPEVNPAISAMRHVKTFSSKIPFFYNQTLVTIYW